MTREALADIPRFIDYMEDQDAEENTKEGASPEPEDVYCEFREQGKDRRRRQALESSLHLKNVEVLSGGA